MCLPELYNEKHVKARKSYNCISCRASIPKGSIYVRINGLWDYGFATYKMCCNCSIVTDAIDKEGLSEDYALDCVRQYLLDIKDDYDNPVEIAEQFKLPLSYVAETLRWGRL